MIKLRMAYIDFMIIYHDEICRKDICKQFNVSPAMATRDFNEYNKLYPDNIEYHLDVRRYKASKGFKMQALKHDTDELIELLDKLDIYK